MIRVNIDPSFRQKEIREIFLGGKQLAFFTFSIAIIHPLQMTTRLNKKRVHPK